MSTSRPRFFERLCGTVRTLVVPSKGVRDLCRRSPVGVGIERVFAVLQFVSVATWVFGSREYAAGLEDRAEFEAWRSWWVDWIILLWAAVMFGSIWDVWGAEPRVPGVVIALGAIRVADILQANVNGHLFDGLRLPGGNTVSSVTRSTLLAVWNYLEVIGWFCIFYMAADGLSWSSDGSKSFQALYFSAITQVTIGFGDLHPDRLPARVLAMTQGLVGTLLLAFAIARFASAVKPLSETRDSK